MTKRVRVFGAIWCIIAVTLGKPSELAFKLSKTSMVPAGTITFKVTNMGVAFHNFKLCAKPLTSATDVADACTGKATPILKHGQTATFTLTISKKGKYEFLCTVTGHAAAGMRGLLGVGVAVVSGEQKIAATADSSAGTGGTTTTPKSSGGGTADVGCPRARWRDSKDFRSGSSLASNQTLLLTSRLATGSTSAPLITCSANTASDS